MLSIHQHILFFFGRAQRLVVVSESTQSVDLREMLASDGSFSFDGEAVCPCFLKK